ncbi:MAG: aromatic amino acid lyase [Crocinitomicaceae bacterium]|nr:aromatic amino acid lyase [Crocinitomicaceae bacterium]NGF77217.1 aromatic amino acid lyase [Fluviicola sp. SGL-29]
MSRITLSDIEKIALNKALFILDETTKDEVKKSFSFLQNFASDKIIYGINTGFGPMAQFKIDEDKLNQLQYNLIRSHSSGTGNPIGDEEARAVLVARANNFLQGNSGVSYGVVEKITEFLNNEIYPEIFEHGGVGASGDLVQLAHLALNLIGEGYVRYKGERRKTADVFKELNIEPLQIQLRDGLGLMNGTSCMTGIAAVNVIYAKRLLDWSIATSAIINEVVESFDDSFSEGLNQVKLHEGQTAVAQKMRTILGDSQLIRKREELFADDEALQQREFKKKIQEYYSIRCVPQILGPVAETLEYAQKVIEREVNSTNDNPIVRADLDNVFHGGNFHGDYISLEMDKVKIVVTKLTMLAERQLNFLLNSKINDLFPPFLNAKTLGFNFGIQGMQFTATSTTAENQMLSNPMYVHSISNNNDNQDIVSMGTNSAVIARKVIENGFQVMAIHMMAVTQAIDLLPEEKRAKLSSKTKEIYSGIRKIVPMINEDVAQFENILEVTKTLRNTTLEL